MAAYPSVDHLGEALSQALAHLEEQRDPVAGYREAGQSLLEFLGELDQGRRGATNGQVEEEVRRCLRVHRMDRSRLFRAELIELVVPCATGGLRDQGLFRAQSAVLHIAERVIDQSPPHDPLSEYEPEIGPGEGFGNVVL